MSLQNTLILLFASFCIWALSLYFTVFYLSPFKIWVIWIVLFYLSLFLASFSFFSFIWFWFRTLLSDKLYFRFFLVNSLRQAFILASITCVSFALLHLKFYSLLNLFWLVCIWFVIEVIYYKLRKID